MFETLVSPSGMVETPRLQAKKRMAIWPKAMSQLKLDQIPLIFSRFQPSNEPTVLQTVVVQLSYMLFFLKAVVLYAVFS